MNSINAFIFACLVLVLQLTTQMMATHCTKENPSLATQLLMEVTVFTACAMPEYGTIPHQETTSSIVCI